MSRIRNTQRLLARAGRHATLLVTLALGGLAALAATGAPASLASSSTAPPASELAGYSAYTTCAEGNETASTEGWRAESAGDYPSMYGNIDTCLEVGGSLLLRDEGTRDSQADSGPMYVFEAPPYETIAGGVLHARVQTDGAEAYVSSPNAGAAIFQCTTGCAAGKQETINLSPANGANRLSVGLVCQPPSGQSECAETNSEIEITSATILLHDGSTPTASDFAGSVLDDPASSEASLTFAAQDRDGPGVYRVIVSVDGEVLEAVTPNTAEGRCVADGSFDGALNFRSWMPCPEGASASVPVPVSGLTNGQHTLEVQVEDAGGQTSQVYDEPIDVQNATAGSPPGTGPAASNPTGSTSADVPSRGAPNGSPASEQATLTARWLTSGGKPLGRPHLESIYGHKDRVAGRLTTASGQPIVGAALEVTQQPAGTGASQSLLATAHTESEGRYELALPATMTSGTVRVLYRSHLADTTVAATSKLTLSMPAKVSLSVSPHVASVGHTIKFVGRVAGPIPPGGKQVVLEARAVGGRWVQFDDPETSARGVWHAKHRFRYRGPERYEFRAICKHEADFPFSQGISRIVSVRER